MIPTINDDFNLEEYGNYRVIEAMQLLIEDLEEEIDSIIDFKFSAICTGRVFELQSVISLIESKYIEGFKTK